MVRWLAALWLALSGCGGAAPAPGPGITNAPPSPAPAVAPAPAEEPTAAPARPWLWEVRPADGGPPSFLLGTIHLGVPLSHALPGAHGARLASARVVVVEMDTVTGAEDMLPLMTLPPGRSLRRMVRPMTWARLREAMPVPEAALDRLQLWAVHSILVMSRLTDAHEDGTGEEIAILDAQVQLEAKATGRELLFLETAHEQVAAMAAVPDEEWIRSVEEVLFETVGARPDVVQAYFTGDSEQVHEAVFGDGALAGSPVYYEKVVFGRNERWLDTLDRQVRQGNAFVAVGLAHMLGERGLVELLRRAGHDVRRLE